MRTQARFIRPSDYENFIGQNLSLLLEQDHNISNSNAADLFLMQVEDKLLTRLDAMSFRTRDWNNLTPFQLESLQKAIIYEAEYLIRNSDLFSDSGYDIEKGEVISPSKLREIEVCRVSTDLLINCGLLNRVIMNRRRWTRFY